MFSAILVIDAGSAGITPGAQASTSSRVFAVASARLIPATWVPRTFSLSLVPPQSGHTWALMNLLTRPSPRSVVALFIASSTAWRALR